MDYIKLAGAILIAVLISSAIMVEFTKPAGTASGSTYDATTWRNPQIFADTVTNQSTLTQTGLATFTGDATVNGGTVKVTSSNTATSTLVAGCIQFYATSTATALNYQASTTPGIMYSQFGSCPNL